ncbi:ParM/StbA family protein [Microcoleus sp. BR0-C5]|uniref:ParM/StbA family protein n=1 Tax=Microcoleus sp. BR0-C5 TaxID=2818713 RepID=UPI002FD6332F
MQTEYRQTTADATQRCVAATRTQLAVDPGNRFVKWVDGQTLHCIPSYVKELADWEEGGNDGQSYEIGFDGKRYIIGRLAQLMGGSPAFEVGKTDLAHLLILPALASDSPQRIERLVIPTPDSRHSLTIAKLKQLEATLEFSVNGHDCLATIRKIEPVDECRGAFDFAQRRSIWRYPNRNNGIVDIGGGTAIARLFMPGGGLLRDADIVLPGTSHLAQRLAAAILPKVGSTADAGMLMDSIASNNYIYGTTGIDFSREFVAVRDAWVADIRQKLNANWMKHLSGLGELIIIGGSASLLQPMCEASKGRFKVAPRPQFFNLYGLNKEQN